LWGGARCGGRRGKRRENGVEHDVNPGHHVTIGEAEDTEALRLEGGRSGNVVDERGIRAVLVSVHLDDQPRLQAAEIGDVAVERDLTAKVRAADGKPLTGGAARGAFPAR
jgi:hypothetical protein